MLVQTTSVCPFVSQLFVMVYRSTESRSSLIYIDGPLLILPSLLSAPWRLFRKDSSSGDSTRHLRSVSVFVPLPLVPCEKSVSPTLKIRYPRTLADDSSQFSLHSSLSRHPILIFSAFRRRRQTLFRIPLVVSTSVYGRILHLTTTTSERPCNTRNYLQFTRSRTELLRLSTHLQNSSDINGQVFLHKRRNVPRITSGRLHRNLRPEAGVAGVTRNDGKFF